MERKAFLILWWLCYSMYCIWNNRFPIAQRLPGAMAGHGFGVDVTMMLTY
jgi:hypothetical protein